MTLFINPCCSHVSSGNITFCLWWAWGTSEDDHKRCLFSDDTLEHSYSEGLSDWDPLRLGCWHLRFRVRQRFPRLRVQWWLVLTGSWLRQCCCTDTRNHWQLHSFENTTCRGKKSWIKWSKSNTHANEQHKHNRVKLCTRDTVLPSLNKGFILCCGTRGVINDSGPLWWLRIYSKAAFIGWTHSCLPVSP